MRSSTSAFISSSKGGETGSARVPVPRAARWRVASSSGAAAIGSQASTSIAVVNAAPDAPMTHSYSFPVATATHAGSVHSRPSPKRMGGMSLRMRLRGAMGRLEAPRALGAVLRKRVLKDRERVERRPLAGVDLRSHAVRVGGATGPPSVRVLTRQEPGDRDLRARIVDRAGGVDRTQHEQD